MVLLQSAISIGVFGFLLQWIGIPEAGRDHGQRRRNDGDARPITHHGLRVNAFKCQTP